MRLGKLNSNSDTCKSLAADITKAASKQTYYTIRLFVDRERVDDAYRAYGYFRWVDDILDSQSGTTAEKLEFVKRQRDLLEACYQGESPADLSIEEQMLRDLVYSDSGVNSELRSYLHHMMAVMEFDAERRGQLVSQAELHEYTRALAIAVTDAMYYFIGHDDPPPDHSARYLPVNAAHIVHMLRDTQEDARNGYFNIPREYLQDHGITAWDVESTAYREWVCRRVQQARRYFKEGRKCISHVKNLRCRLAGYAYTARFEWMLRTIERDRYCLRSEYPERRSLSASLWMSWTTLTSLFTSPLLKTGKLASQPIRIDDR